MYPTFRDETAEIMKAAQKKIGPAVLKHTSRGHDFNKAASGGIAHNFYDSEPSGVKPLSTDALVSSLAGAKEAENTTVGFKDLMRSLYPTNPAMWSVPNPASLVGGMVPRPLNVAAPGGWDSRGGWGWPAEGSKAATGAVSKSAEVDKESVSRLAALGDAIARLKAVQAVKALVDSGEIDRAVAAAMVA